ncbi:unnamed protein product [Callosobruchus maculatus]|uniref:Uncharacterized protein n=1 Tax=Callosobruchus maculatus TaxID=64391 RepID=A0A653D5M0_CALMS|nr:unnamed protein product [Callosobruchus maculatus]
MRSVFGVFSSSQHIHTTILKKGCCCTNVVLKSRLFWETIERDLRQQNTKN